jgi:hypothetical protein
MVIAESCHVSFKVLARKETAWTERALAKTRLNFFGFFHNLSLSHIYAATILKDHFNRTLSATLMSRWDACLFNNPRASLRPKGESCRSSFNIWRACRRRSPRPFVRSRSSSLISPLRKRRNSSAFQNGTAEKEKQGSQTSF